MPRAALLLRTKSSWSCVPIHQGGPKLVPEAVFHFQLCLQLHRSCGATFAESRRQPARLPGTCLNQASFFSRWTPGAVMSEDAEGKKKPLKLRINSTWVNSPSANSCCSLTTFSYSFTTSINLVFELLLGLLPGASNLHILPSHLQTLSQPRAQRVSGLFVCIFKRKSGVTRTAKM